MAAEEKDTATKTPAIATQSEAKGKQPEEDCGCQHEEGGVVEAEKDSGGTTGIPPRYREMGFSGVGEKKSSTRPEKKWMVLAKKGDNFKVVHGGDAHMEDFSQHHDEKRRQRFWIRMGGKDSPQARDPFSPLYWHKKFKTWDAGGVLNDDAIKVVWIDTDKPETLESKMFDHLRDALRYAEGKTHLIMQLQEQEGNYYRWKLLPYGEHEKYKVAVDTDNFFSLSGDGGAIDFKIGSIDLRMEQGGTAGAAEKKNELITDPAILATLPKGIGKTLTYRDKYHNSIQHYFISEVPDYRDVHTNEVKPFLVNVRAIYPDGKEIDNAYASFKTLHQANTYIDYLVASDFREDKTVKPPYRQELGKKYEGLAESTANIMLKKKQLDQDYDWQVESFGAGRDKKFYLRGRLKNLPYKLPEVKETAQTLTTPPADFAKTEQWWNEISPTDRLKYVFPSMVEKHDLPEYTTDWHWNTLPAEVQQHIAAEMQKKEAEYAVIASEAKGKQSPEPPVEHENVPRETLITRQVQHYISKMGVKHKVKVNLDYWETLQPFEREYYVERIGNNKATIPDVKEVIKEVRAKLPNAVKIEGAGFVTTSDGKQFMYSGSDTRRFIPVIAPAEQETVSRETSEAEETLDAQYRRIVDTAWLFTKNQFIELVRKYDPYPVKDDLWLRNQESIHKAAVATAMQKKTGANRSEEQERSQYEVAINEGKLNGADVAEIIKSAGLQVPFYFRYRVFTVFKSGKPSQETEFNLTLQQANMLFEKMTKDPDAEIVTMDYAKDNEQGRREANVTVKMWTAPNVQSVTMPPNTPQPAIQEKPVIPLSDLSDEQLKRRYDVLIGQMKESDVGSGNALEQQVQAIADERVKRQIVNKSGIPAENLILASMPETETIPKVISAKKYKSSTCSDAYNFVKHQQEYCYSVSFEDGRHSWTGNAKDRAEAVEKAINNRMQSEAYQKRKAEKEQQLESIEQHDNVLHLKKHYAPYGAARIVSSYLRNGAGELMDKDIDIVFENPNYNTPETIIKGVDEFIKEQREKAEESLKSDEVAFERSGSHNDYHIKNAAAYNYIIKKAEEVKPIILHHLLSTGALVQEEEIPATETVNLVSETPDLTNTDKTEIVQNETAMKKHVWMQSKQEIEEMLKDLSPNVVESALKAWRQKVENATRTIGGDWKAKNSDFMQAIQRNELTPEQAITIITDAGVTVPEEIQKLTTTKNEITDSMEKQAKKMEEVRQSLKRHNAPYQEVSDNESQQNWSVSETADIAENPSSWFFDDNYFTEHPDHVLGIPYQTSGLHGEVTKYKGDLTALAGIKAPLDFLEAFPQDNPLLSVDPPTTQAAITTPEGQNAAETAIRKSRKSVAQKKKMKTLEQQSPTGEVPVLQDKLAIHRAYNNNGKQYKISNDELFAFMYYYDSIGRRLSQHWYDLSFQLGNTIESMYDELTIARWVREGILFYYGGFDERTGSNKLLHSAYYLAGNVKDRHAQLERDKDRIVELYGIDVYEAQKVAIDKAFSERKHNWLRIGGTEEKMPLLLLPNSEFAQKFMIEALIDEEPFHFRIKSSTGKPDFFNADFKPRNYISYSQKKYYKQFTQLSLTDAFCAWMLTDNSIIFKKGVTAYDIIKYYVMNGNMVYTGAKDDDRAKKQFEDYKMRMKQNTKQEGDRLFQEFLQKQLKQNDILRIEYQWNGTYNSNVPVDYNKIPVVFECAQEYSGENPLVIKPEKREAAAFTFTEGAGCLAYGTGVGKTMSSIFTVAQFLYAGFAKRPLVVTPNQVYKQFIAEIKGILPQFNVLGLYNMGDDYLDLLRDAKGAITMVPENTICVMTYEGFKRLGFNEKTRNELIWQMYDILDQSEEANKMSDAKRTKFMEDLEALVGGGEKGGMVNIEDTGLDFFVLDEAHKMKKVFVSVKGRALPNQKGAEETTEKGEKGGVARSRSGIDIKGGSKPSQVALKGFMLCQYIMRNNYGSNVLLLTATPFTNSALEVYSMLSMVAFEKMKQYGVHNIVDFFDNFINMKYDLVINSRNQPEKKQIIDGFNNAYALNRMVTRFINRKSEDEVKAKKPRKIILPRIEKMENGVRVALDENEKIETFLPMTAEQERMMQEIIDYAEGKINLSEIAVKTPPKTLINKEDVSTDVESGEASVDTTEGYELDEEFMDSSERDKARYIRAINYAQMLAISPYLYKHSGKTNPTPKQFIDSSPKLRYIMDCIKSVKQWHDKQTDPLLRQMSGQIIYSNRGLEFFEEIRSYLIEVIGFKADEVEIITAKNPSNGDRSKSSIQDRFLGQRYNEASMMYEEIPDEQRVKVIIGSSVIKEGMNLQKFSSVLYNCYIEWNPTDVIQLEGRIWRQGNQFGAVRIVIPMLIDSIDIFLFQKLQEKTARINSIWQVDGKTSQIKLEEFDAEELKFALIRDARVLAKMKIESEEAKLREESSVFKQEIEKVNNIKEYVKDIENHLKDAQDWLAEYRVVKKRGEETIWDYAKYLATTMNLVMRKPTDKEGRKIYDNTWSDEYKKDKNPSPLSYPKKPYWFEDFSKAQRGLVRAADSFLRPKNLTLNDLDGYTEKAQKEIEALEEEIVKIGDDKNIERMAREIEQERAEKKIETKSLPEVVQAFIKLNDECLGSRSLFQKIGTAKPMFTTCPPLDANGNRLITPDAVKYLESCIAKDPDTKLLHSSPLPDGSAKYHPYREALHDEIIDILLQRAQCVKGNTAPIAVLTGGAPASGKTRWLKSYAPYIKDFVLHIDADEIRSALPEYKGWNANSTFNEAKDIVNKLLDKVGTPCTQDILYDGTMGNSEKYFKLVRKLKKMGYKVFVAFMDVPEAVAQERALERYQKYGRYVSHNVISSFYNQDDAGKPTLKQLKGNVDGYIVVDGMTGEVKEQGGMEIPTDRPYLKAIASGLKDLKGKMDDAIKALEKLKAEGATV